MWLSKVQETKKNLLEINWKAFSLEQANQKIDPSWKVWDQPDDYPTKGLLAQRAAEAAKRQGTELFQTFHLNLLKARHEERKDLNDRDMLFDVAKQSGLDTNQFRSDLSDRSVLKSLAIDHYEAVDKYGVFGTPTFVFENGSSAFLKLLKPPDNEAVKTFENLLELMQQRLYVGEFKRPQPPWPKGAYAG